MLCHSITHMASQVWGQSCTHLLYIWSLPPDKGNSSASPPATYARGAAINVTNDGTVNLCFGSSSGNVYAIEVAEADSINPSFKTPIPFKAHSFAVTAVSSAYQTRRGKWTADLGCQLVSADEDGGIIVWEGLSTRTYNVLLSIPSTGMPAVSLAVRGDMVVAGRLDGAVQVYGLVGSLKPFKCSSTRRTSRRCVLSRLRYSPCLK